MRRQIVSLVLLLFAAVLPPAAGARASGSCGRVTGGIDNDPFSWYAYTVDARGTPCARARAVARVWGKATSVDGPAPSSVTAVGFACRAVGYGRGAVAARCARGSSSIALLNAPKPPAIVDLSSISWRPATISQGASHELFHLRWTSWGGATAFARGQDSEGAGASNSRVFPASVDAYAIGTCQGLRAYTRLRVRNLNTGSTIVETLDCAQRQYI